MVQFSPFIHRYPPIICQSESHTSFGYSHTFFKSIYFNMIGMKSLAAFVAIVSVAYAAAVPAPEDEWHHALLKRQEPGTPLFACHEACGTAITLSRGASPCTDVSFLTDYADCLVCSGPDDFNIWRYYGGTLTTAGTKCGLSNTPVSGTPISSTSSAPAPVISSTPGPTTESTTALDLATTPRATTTSTSASKPNGEASTTPASVSESASVTAYPTASTTSATVSTTIAPNYIPSSTSSLTTTASNSTSTAIPFTGGADSANRKMAGALAVVVGVVFAAVL
ncbi:hypothetical protein BKA65DRAFT_59785 [Rhexocercosporidium sp. MPI-PUGE-AT-0058]|nr:hypothetical protein BKA65DRAFT_59785 [Rhexocercosporidium sp. MPI-PUGE-AT-0058]